MFFMTKGTWGLLPQVESELQVPNYLFPRHPQCLQYQAGVAPNSLTFFLAKRMHPLPHLPHDPNDPDYQEVDLISEQVQNYIVAGATRLLQQRVPNLQNPDDIKRAVDMAMSEEWEVPIEGRIEHFRGT